eukprot:TRINITY_DN10071_c0_g1_i1.p1 TRINITY_DN10071_c0_g1~~TRINITY_DN10071_c0_g1_i1.p1  ORF type:complete len:345 (+),score=87.26 TRINITY_DN10071_c0_g1_i1:209-1243(+)
MNSPQVKAASSTKKRRPLSTHIFAAVDGSNPHLSPAAFLSHSSSMPEIEPVKPTMTSTVSMKTINLNLPAQPQSSPATAPKSSKYVNSPRNPSMLKRSGTDTTTSLTSTSIPTSSEGSQIRKTSNPIPQTVSQASTVSPPAMRRNQTISIMSSSTTPASTSISPTTTATGATSSGPTASPDDVVISALAHKLFNSKEPAAKTTSPPAIVVPGRNNNSPSNSGTQGGGIEPTTSDDNAMISNLVQSLYYNNANKAKPASTLAPPVRAEPSISSSSQPNPTALAHSLEPIIETLLLSSLTGMAKQIRSELEARFDSHFKELVSETEKMEQEIVSLRTQLEALQQSS